MQSNREQPGYRSLCILLTHYINTHACVPVGYGDVSVFTAEKEIWFGRCNSDRARLLHIWSVCLKDTNDCNLIAIERDGNELGTICLM